MATLITLPNSTVVKKRNAFAPLGLAIITLGFYLLYWYYAINRELRDDGADVSPGVALLAVTLGAILIVPPFVSIYNTCQRIEDSQARHGVTSRISPVLGLVLWVFISPAAFVYMQAEINKSWERVAG